MFLATKCPFIKQSIKMSHIHAENLNPGGGISDRLIQRNESLDNRGIYLQQAEANMFYEQGHGSL